MTITDFFIIPAKIIVNIIIIIAYLCLFGLAIYLLITFPLVFIGIVVAFILIKLCSSS